MSRASEAVLNSHNMILKERGLNLQSSQEMTLNRECGMDSLGIVTFILNIEEELAIELDEVLGDIRRSKSISEVIEVIENAIGE